MTDTACFAKSFYEGYLHRYLFAFIKFAWDSCWDLRNSYNDLAVSNIHFLF